jgi:glucose-6-phosphate 1-dehydrogenase
MLETLANPLLEGLHEQRIPEPCCIVIFGASGDLTRRKLIPALYSLAADHLLPSHLAILGCGRVEMDTAKFREDMRSGCEQFARAAFKQDVWDDFAQGLYYLPGNFDDDAGFQALKAQVEEIERKHGLPGNRLFYLAVPPSQFPIVGRHLPASGLTYRCDEGQPFSRLIIEKPFGRDLESARSLNRVLRDGWEEEQIYRIDHYLGKETVQNIMAFRFGNAIFEPLWNNNYVDHVEITVAESIGTGGRGGYYETSGALRDMVQNHIFQLLTMTAMEPPISTTADAIRDEKVKVLQALRPLSPQEVPANTARGQYVAGSVDGEDVPGYQEEGGVAKGSCTETFVALKVMIDNWRWAGVPFYIRTGKRLPKRVSEISIVFRKVPHLLFKGANIEPNVLAIRIQPDEGIVLKVGSKVPGAAMKINPVLMEFRYGTSFGAEPPEAYERLLLDSLLGDSTLFTRSDEVEASWRWINRVLEAWQHGAPPDPYPAGSWGPDSASDLLHRDGRHWRHL